MQKSKMAVWGGLKIVVKRREAKSKGEKERYKHLNTEFQRIARRDKKAFLSDQCKEIEENNRTGKTRDLFKIMIAFPLYFFFFPLGDGLDHCLLYIVMNLCP